MLLKCGNATAEYRLSDESQWHAVLQRADAGPLTGSLLSRRIENVFKKVVAVSIDIAEDIGRNFHQVTVQNPGIPTRKNLLHFRITETGTQQQMVSLTDQLHIAIFDAIVHHLHIVAGSTTTHPVAAGFIVTGLGGNCLQYGVWTAGHAATLPPGIIDGP